MPYSIEPFISEEDIQTKVRQLASEINDHYDGQPIVVLGILKGSFMFLSDLVKHLNMPLEIEFMSISSYGDDMESSGKLRIELDVRKSIAGKRVLLVEDLIDTGNSLFTNLETLRAKNPLSLDVVTLLSKNKRREKDVNITFNGFTIENKFVVGYGMDYAEKHRNLPHIGVVSFSNE